MPVYLRKEVSFNIVYSAFGGSYKGFGLGSFTKLISVLIRKCLETPNDTIYEERLAQAWQKQNISIK